MSTARPSPVRLLLGLAGLVLIGVGAFSLREFGLLDLFWVAVWLVAGVAAHDGILAPGFALLSRSQARRVPKGMRRWVAVAVVPLAALTLIAVPLILQRDAVAGNPSLLGRNYLLGWLAACLAVLVGVGIGYLVSRGRAPRSGPRPLSTGRG